MARQALGPRLYLARADDRPPTWVIRDGSRFIRTGCAEADRQEAEKRYQEYLFADGIPPTWLSPHSIAHRIRKPTTIYFATCDVDGFPIKIGTTADVPRRIAGLQTALPYKILLLGTMAGNEENERRLHTGFYRDRLRGEWFKRSLLLMGFIQAHAKAP